MKRRHFLVLVLLSIVALVAGAARLLLGPRRPHPPKPHRDRAPIDDTRSAMRALFLSLGPFPPSEVDSWRDRFVHPDRVARYEEARDDLIFLARRFRSDAPLAQIDLSGLSPSQRALLDRFLNELYCVPVSVYVFGDLPLGQCVGPTRHTMSPEELGLLPGNSGAERGRQGKRGG